MMRRAPVAICGLAILALACLPGRAGEERGDTAATLAGASLPEIAPPPGLPPELLAAPGGSGTTSARTDAAFPSDLTLVRDAVAAYRTGDVAGGDRLRERVTDPAAALTLEWVAVRFGGAAIGYERIAAFARANPDWPSIPWLRRRAEDKLIAERKPAPVLRAFFARERPQSASGKIALAVAFRAEDLPGEAAALIREAWRNDVFGRELEAKTLEEFPGVLTSADHRARMERLLFKENWDGAKRAAELAGKGYDSLVKARMAVDAKAAAAKKLLDAVPAGLREDSSYKFSLAQHLRQSAKPAEAAKALADVPRDPAILADGDEWWTERRRIARNLLDLHDYRTAYAVVERHAATASEKRLEAEFMAGWIGLRFLGQADVGARHFERAASIAATPISLARARYWQGRAAEAAGSAAEARGFYEEAARQGTTYYGQLAGAKLGWSRVPIRPATDPGSPDRLEAARAPAVRAVEILYTAGLRDVAAPLAVELGRHGSRVAELEAVAELAHMQRDARTLLALGKSATQRGLPLDEAAFPTIGIPAYEPVGARVEPAMVHAIARQESAFDPAAGSPVGARGLMQLMPGTAQGVARRFKVEYDPNRLLDGSYNAQLGAAHLGELMEDWRGSFILTFASYNAGPGNVRKWIDAYGDPRKPDTDPVDWVERIPFHETRNYVQRVMENLQVYRKRLDSRSALLIESDLRRGGSSP
jgi:soluble lytic murein transglycosylase